MNVIGEPIDERGAIAAKQKKAGLFIDLLLSLMINQQKLKF